MTDNNALIRAQRERSNRAIAARDLDGIVAIMMPDVIVAVAGGPRLSGREASRAAFVEQMADPSFVNYVRDIERITVAASGKHATEHGRWSGLWREKTVDHIMGGTYSAEWSHTDGGWLIQSETFVEEPE